MSIDRYYKTKAEALESERDEAIATNAKLERRLADQIEESDALKADIFKWIKTVEDVASQRKGLKAELAKANGIIDSWKTITDTREGLLAEISKLKGEIDKLQIEVRRFEGEWNIEKSRAAKYREALEEIVRLYSATETSNWSKERYIETVVLKAQETLKEAEA